MIEVNNITFEYKRHGALVFDGLSLRLEENRIYGLLGKNGTGKSTFLYLCSGLLHPAAGTVRCDGVNPAERRPDMLQDMFLVAEEFELPPVSLREYVRLNSPFYPHFSADVLQHCLHDFELDADVQLHSLSMGQRKKAYIAFAVAAQTKYLFMDEPTNGLDIPSKSQFRRVIAQHMSDRQTIVIATHLVHDVEPLLDHILIFNQRALLLDASVRDLAERYVFDCRTPQQMDADVLYAAPTLQGNAVIARRKPGDAETPLNVELLFNYITTQKS